jgi:hypothetical protein
MKTILAAAAALSWPPRLPAVHQLQGRAVTISGDCKSKGPGCETAVSIWQLICGLEHGTNVSGSDPCLSRTYVCWTSECNALTAASRFSTGTNRLTECGDNTYLSGTIP